MQTFLVGGAVRDRLLNIEVKDRDWVVTGASIQNMIDLNFTPVGKDFPVFLHPKTKEEYALARTERKSGQGYKGFEVYASPDVTLEEDLLRRDLTINAMAQSDQGQIFDPYNGQQDIKDKILRHVSDAFTEDPLRVLRIARFAARFEPLGFRIAPETMELMKQITESGELNSLVAERVWQETSRALSEQSPATYFEILKHCGALNVLFPELDRLFGVPQAMKWHPEIDTGIHTLMSLKKACEKTPDVAVRFAALCHDVGKGNTAKDLIPHHYGHEQRGAKLIRKMCARLKLPKQIETLSSLVAEFHTHCHTIASLKPSTILKLLKALAAFRDQTLLKQFILCCESDFQGRSGWGNLAYTQGIYLLQAANAASQVGSKELIAQGFEGKALGERIDQERVLAINMIKTNWTDN